MTQRTLPAAILLAGTCLAAFLMLDRPTLLPVPHGQKPMFPVLAQLEMLNRPEPGGTARVLATLTAWAPGEAIEWRLELPPEVALVSGPDRWDGQLANGESRSFEIALAIPDGRHHEVTARARLTERPRATTAATLPIDLGPLEGLKATGRTVTADGETYLQYQGEVRPRKEGE